MSIDLKLRETTYDGETYVFPTPDQMSEYAFELAKSIIESGEEFDMVVALAKGGLTWLKELVDYLKIHPIAYMRVETYHAIGQPSKPMLSQPLCESVTNLRLLVFDEIVDSGATLEFTEPYLISMGAGSLKTASICLKPTSRRKPNFYSLSTSAWVVFPCEIRETTEDLFEKWTKMGHSVETVIERLVTIGLPENRVRFFVDLILKENEALRLRE